MRNIVDILHDLGIEIGDKADAIIKAVAENYKTVVEHDKKIAKLETERDGYKSRAESAEETLRGFDGVDAEGMKREIADWKAKAEAAQREYATKIEQRDFDDALRAEIESVRFSSDAAKRAVIAEIREKGLKLSDGRILGFADAIAQIRERDASAFVDEREASRAVFTARQPQGSGTGGKVYTSREEIMSIKDTSERQAAIAANIGLFRG